MMLYVVCVFVCVTKCVCFVVMYGLVLYSRVRLYECVCVCVLSKCAFVVCL